MTAVVQTSLIDMRVDMKLGTASVLRGHVRTGVIGVFVLRRMEPGCHTQMDAAAVPGTPITVVSLGDPVRATSKSLWHLFVAWCDGKALGMVTLSNKIGLVACRQLKTGLRSTRGQKFHSTVCTSFSTRKRSRPTTGNVVWTSSRGLTSMEAIVGDYSSQSSEPLSSVCVPTVKRLVR